MCFRLCSTEGGSQPILAIADQSIPGVEEADPFYQASTPKDRWLAHRTHKRVMALEVWIELDGEVTLPGVAVCARNAQVSVDQLLSRAVAAREPQHRPTMEDADRR